MANTIQIKRSPNTTDPTGLAKGELAWLDDGTGGAAGKLFIGDATAGGAVVRHIAGIGAGAVAVATDLSGSTNSATYTVNSSTGTNVTIPEATGSVAGMFTVAHHDKLDAIEASADVTDTGNVTSSGALMDSECTDLAAVKATEDPFTAALLSKLNAIEASADVTDTANVTSSGALMDSECTDLAAVKATEDPFTAALLSKLNAIEASADVTDTANVTSAGALMDSELASIGSVKAFTGEAAATADQTADEIGTLFAADDTTVTFGGDVTVTGDLIVSGDTTTVNTATMTVEDPLMILASGNTGDVVDTGFYNKYVVGVTSKWAGVIRDVSTAGDPWTFFDSLTTEPTTTVTVGSNNFAYAPISCGEVKSDGAISGTAFTGAGTGLTGTGASFTAGAVSTIAGLAPNTATTQATQGAITSCANLATVGTITTGVWSGTALVAAKVPAITALTGYTAAAYANASSVGAGTIVTVGALTSGSIASGFTSISTSYTDAKCTVAAADQTSANSAAGLTGTPSITVAVATTTGAIQLGHASDTTIARDSGGVVSIEGNVVIVDDSTINGGTY